MKFKILVFKLILLLIISISAVAQNKVIEENWGVKKSIETDKVISGLAKPRDKARVVLLAATVWTKYYGEDVFYLDHFVKLEKIKQIRFYVDYTAVSNTQVRFRYIWTGPECFSYTTNWYSASYNKYNYVYVYYTEPDWKKGTYKLVIIAEQKSIGAGTECVAECVFRIY